MEKWLLELICPKPGCSAVVSLKRSTGDGVDPPPVEVSSSSILEHNHPGVHSAAVHLLPGHRGLPPALRPALVRLSSTVHSASDIYDQLALEASSAKLPITFDLDMVKNELYRLRNNSSTNDAVRLWQRLLDLLSPLTELVRGHRRGHCRALALALRMPPPPPALLPLQPPSEVPPV